MIGVLAGPGAEVEDQLYQIVNVAVLLVRGCYVRGHDVVGDCKGGVVLLFDIFIS